MISDEGILNSVSSEDISELLGGSLTKHISVMITKELVEMSQTSAWPQTTRLFPWKTVHLYTDHGDEGIVVDLSFFKVMSLTLITVVQISSISYALQAIN